MIVWNPVPHVKHAWTMTKTVWGKIALVLFYSFIWFNIATVAYGIANPSFMGGNCFTQTTKNAKTQTQILAILRCAYIMIIGFLLYADVGGLKVKNVAMVAIFVSLFMFTVAPAMNIGVNESACDPSEKLQLWLLPGWAVVALFFTFLEEKLGDHGTGDETTPLNR